MEARNAALKEERDAAYDAYLAEIQLAGSIEDMAAAAATVDFGLPEGVASALIDMGNAFDSAAEAASDFQSVMDVFLDGVPDYVSAISATEAALADLADGMQVTKDGVESTL